MVCAWCANRSPVSLSAGLYGGVSTVQKSRNLQPWRVCDQPPLRDEVLTALKRIETEAAQHGILKRLDAAEEPPATRLSGELDDPALRLRMGV